MKLISLNAWMGREFKAFSDFFKNPKNKAEIYSFQEITSNIGGVVEDKKFRANFLEDLKKLFPDSDKMDSDALVLLRNQFKSIEEGIEESKRREEAIRKSVRELSLEGLKHIQKVEVLRYNPYEDTGGSMSFSIALLDGNINGFILTSLHTRAGTRIYTKKIEKGKCELHLSKEEDEVLRLAASK